jgi:hypothetical protein
LNRRELLLRALKGQVRLLELQREHGWDRETLLQATVLLDDPYPFTLHFSAFMAVIENQGTEEQIKEWIPKCERMEVLGMSLEMQLMQDVMHKLSSKVQICLMIDWAMDRMSRDSRLVELISPPQMNLKLTRRL